ncbi:MAG: hypothetical protein DSY80_07735 [Desulfocapsa sp.]|nr:MAG: hypothetical protein DSY80_07735 [Desulfocapsa sp.]
MKTINDVKEKFVRAKFARYINKHPPMQWHPSANQPGTYYQGGYPDGFITYYNRIWWVEIKLLPGPSVFMGVPGDPERTKGWHERQRAWWRNVALVGGTPYYIALFYGDNVVWRDAYFAWVTPGVWLQAEDFFRLHIGDRPKRSVPPGELTAFFREKDVFVTTWKMARKHLVRYILGYKPQ